MKNNVLRIDSTIEHEKQFIEIDVTCRNVEESKELEVRESIKKFINEVEKITGWK